MIQKLHKTKLGLMHKIGEKIFWEDDRMVVKTTVDANGMINDAAYSREVAPSVFGSDHKHVGNVDVVKVHEWLKEAGVEWHDTHAVQEVIKKKLISGEYSKLRNWGGTW